MWNCIGSPGKGSKICKTLRQKSISVIRTDTVGLFKSLYLKLQNYDKILPVSFESRDWDTSDTSE